MEWYYLLYYMDWFQNKAFNICEKNKNTNFWIQWIKNVVKVSEFSEFKIMTTKMY